MPLLDSGPGSAQTLLGLYWKWAAVAVVGAAGSHGLAGKQRDLVQPCWLSNETESRKLERRACANIGYEEKPNCLIARR